MVHLGRIPPESLKSATVAHFQRARGLPGGVPEASWGVLGASWGLLAGSWGRLAASWGPPKAVLGQLGALLGRLQRVLRYLRSVLSHLGASWRVLARLEAVWTESWPPGGGAKAVAARCPKPRFWPLGARISSSVSSETLGRGCRSEGGSLYYPNLLSDSKGPRHAKRGLRRTVADFGSAHLLGPGRFGLVS